MKKALSLTALIIAVTLTLAGCGNNGTGGTSDTSVNHNQQDITFATDMIPHHLQAVQMAEMAQTQASLPAVKTLADQIQTAQGPEIDTMTQWLKSWGEDVPDESMGGMDMGSSESMPGMMSDQVMSDLGAANGPRFDRLWLESMITHHEGAVQMADTEIADGKDPDAIAFAKSIKAAQTTEIATMTEAARALIIKRVSPRGASFVGSPPNRDQKSRRMAHAGGCARAPIRTRTSTRREMMQEISRRGLLLGGLAVAGAGALVACSNSPGAAPTTFARPTRLQPLAGQRVVEHQLTAKATSLDLGGTTVETWAFGDTVPGPLIRATAGDMLRVRVNNQLPTDTSVHWHGIALRNVADGVPGLTQDPIAADSSYLYEFTAPDPGTYFYHPHVGVQLDRGLYAPLIIDDPREPGDYDLEWVVVLDDWVDGTGRTPDEVLDDLTGSAGASSDPMGGMDMGGMDMGGKPPFGDAGDVTYPHYLINGRVPSAPDVLRGKPGQRVRLRIINAGSDTIFTVALGGHRLTVTHTDGFAVQPRDVGAVYLGMGERYDATVTLGAGVFPLVAAPYGKAGQAMALIRTGSGAAPGPTVRPSELDGPILQGAELQPTEASRLSTREPDSTQMVHLSGQMMPYRWAINGAPYGKNQPLLITKGDRVRLELMNMTQMTHPMHIHGHTFALPSGLRKDTVLVKPMSSLAVELQADNPGNWMTHCHNIYHAESGMMIALNYRV